MDLWTIYGLNYNGGLPSLVPAIFAFPLHFLPQPFESRRTDGGSFAKPWFGQLMMGPQLLAYFIQLELWLRRYQIRIEF